MTDLEKLAQFTEKELNKKVSKKWDDLTEYCHRQNKTPQLFLIGGQPGAGKTSTISQVEELLQGNCVIINLDDYRALHPNAKEIYEKGIPDSDDYSVYTNPFMREVGEKILDKAIENGYNVILERTLSSTDAVSKQLDKFQQNGYELNLYVVTCNKNHSMSSVEQRYTQQKVKFQKDKENQEPPRKISKEFQKECYENLGKSTEYLAKKYDFKNVKIFFRNLQYKQDCVFDKNSNDKINNIDKIEKLINRMVNGKRDNSITKEELDEVAKKTSKAVQDTIKDKTNDEEKGKEIV